jgi:hypothetical protein
VLYILSKAFGRKGYNRMDITPQESARSAVDRIGDKEQREAVAHRVGLTREKLYSKIVQGLQAKKMGDIVQENGDIKRGLVDDRDLQKWAVEQGLKVFQDDRGASVSIEGNTVNNNTLNIDVSKLDASQLIDLLMGRNALPIEAKGKVKP